MSRLSTRQVAVLRRLAQMGPVGGRACTRWVARGAAITTAQAYAACRRLEFMGLAREVQPHTWAASSSGQQWLRYLDAGRPWLVRGAAR